MADSLRKMTEGSERLSEEIEVPLTSEEVEVPLTSQCGVCTAPAANIRHYGAVSCYSCK